MKSSKKKTKEPSRPRPVKPASISFRLPPNLLLGSGASAVPLRERPRDDDGDGPSPDDDDGGTPVPSISVPDFAIQFAACLPNDGVRKEVHDEVQKAFPTGDVRGPKCVNGTERLGIWFVPPSSNVARQARDNGLDRLAILLSGKQFTVFVNGSSIRSHVQQEARKQGFSFNHAGKADPNGDIIVQSVRVDFKQSKSQVIVTIEGYDKAPWPDVNFTVTITDTLSVLSGEVHCVTDRDLDVDKSLLHVLEGLTLVLTLALPQLFLIPFILFSADAIISALDAPPIGQGGAGCSAARGFPSVILIHGKQKIEFQYTSPVVCNNGGIFAGGNLAIVPRVPRVSIVGPEVGGNQHFRISVEKAAKTAVVEFRAATFDMIGKKTFVWGGDGTVLSTSGNSAVIRFNLGSSTGVKPVTRTVTVRATDEDGLTDDSTRQIDIFRARLDEDEISPICRAKPWLPQCN